MLFSFRRFSFGGKIMRSCQGLQGIYNSLEERIDGLKESYEIEALKKDEALADYKKQVFILEAERMDFIEELENRKTERKVEFVKMRRNDPEGFILKIETQFGFEHVE